MKRLIKYLKQLFAIHNISNSAELTICCSDLDAAEKLWQDVYMPGGWDVKEPIETRWNWKRFDYEYMFKLIKP